MGKRVVVLVLGVILLLIGASAAVGGAALMAVFGSDDTLTSGSEPLSTQHVALVASLDDIQDTHGLASVVELPTIALKTTGTSGDVFVGIGPADDVERYLAGVNIDRVTDLKVDPFRLETTPRPGSASPSAPSEQTFWTASSHGSSASITWKVKDGSYRLVLMNADASPGVDANGSVSLKVPNLFVVGVALLAVGVVLVVLGVVVLVVGARMREHPAPQAYAL